MSRLLYNLFIQLFPRLVSLAALFNTKARKWKEGRVNILSQLENTFAGETRPVAWMHCASLGEFEQGRPVFERFKELYPGHCFLVTFFSPSGYEVQKNYSQADHIFYLPIDSRKNAEAFVRIVKPTIVMFVKYEFWLHYLEELKKKSITVILASGIFRSSQPFFRWYGGLYRTMLRCFTTLYVQNEESLKLLQGIGFTNVTISGDTRFDRVLQVKSHFVDIPAVQNFCADNKVIVAGSTWRSDDEVLSKYANTHTNIRFVIAPHDISSKRIEECKSLYHNSILFSEYINSTGVSHNASVLIIDNVGMLSRLYAYSTVSFVGGAFDKGGVHNVLEPAVFAKPVVFGHVYQKYAEAIALIECQGGISVSGDVELAEAFDKLLNDSGYYISCCNNAGEYVIKHAGATEVIVNN